MSVIIAIIIFGIVVVVHEAGHFLIAKKNGVYVEEFAIGMGPVLLKKKGKETLYTIRIFPIGGFCKMVGEDEEVDAEILDEIGKDRSFSSKSVLQRMAIVVGGAFFNLILAIVLFLIIFLNSGITTSEIGGIIDNSPAAESNMQVGDELLSINGNNVSTPFEIMMEMDDIEDPNISYTYEHNGEEISDEMTLMQDPTDGGYIMGVQFVSKPGAFSGEENNATFMETVGYTFDYIEFYIKYTFIALGDLITGNSGLDNLAGPIGIVSTVDDVYTEASQYSFSVVIFSMLNFVATISLALGIFNMLPFPALDGGRFIFLIIEGIRKKPISPEIEGRIHIAGFAILIVFGIVVAFHDVFNLIG